QPGLTTGSLHRTIKKTTIFKKRALRKEPIKIRSLEGKAPLMFFLHSSQNKKQSPVNPFGKDHFP
ncbi:hypothetical protein, partial [Bacillus sp. MUM 13]|uniref:hypothetical protein n=1 Tax=Bacillus sp. MUM 13 TaxID=1678001 RepID=UPI00196A9628